MRAWTEDCDDCGAPAYSACAAGCALPRARPDSVRQPEPGVVRRFYEGAHSTAGAGDSEYLEFRAHHPRAWVINRHGKTGEMVHRIDCIHFYDEQPSTKDSPKLVGTTRDALVEAEPRFGQIPRCSSCG